MHLIPTLIPLWTVAWRASMFNNAPLVIKVSQELDDSEVEPARHGVPRERCRSDPCLPSRLPANGVFPLFHMLLDTNIR